MSCQGKNSLQIFQKGILMFINGTRYLLKMLKEYGLNYLLTSKINQDALEILFSQVRSRGGLNDHPIPLNQGRHFSFKIGLPNHIFTRPHFSNTTHQATVITMEI